MPCAQGEAAIAGEGGELVDRAPGHVHGGEVAPRGGDAGDPERLYALAQAARAARPRRDRMTRSGQETAERACVRRLLVKPGGEEASDPRIVDCARRQQLAQID